MAKKDTSNLVKRINAVKKQAADFPVDADMNELLKIIHRPGWTTPAELLFVLAGLEALEAQLQAIGGLSESLLAASRAVGRE